MKCPLPFMSQTRVNQFNFYDLFAYKHNFLEQQTQGHFPIHICGIAFISLSSGIIFQAGINLHQKLENFKQHALFSSVRRLCHKRPLISLILLDFLGYKHNFLEYQTQNHLNIHICGIECNSLSCGIIFQAGINLDQKLENFKQVTL